MSRTRVLLVDDEQDYLEAMAKRMKHRGLEVSTANDGALALELIRERPFDVVMLDILMPEMDGIETLKHIREDKPDLEVIVVTAHGTVRQGVSAMKMGATNVVLKPADIEELVSMANEAHVHHEMLERARQKETIRKIIVEHGW